MRIAVATTLLAAGLVHAQAPQPLGFDAALVTRNVTGFEEPLLLFPSTDEAGSIWNATTEGIIEWAYQLQDSSQVIRPDGPTFDWKARFDIQARPRNGTPPEQQFDMLRTLLADRFKLRVHNETRELPVYALTVAREGLLGPQLRSSWVDCEAPYNSLARLRRAIEGQDDFHLLCEAPLDASIPDVTVVRSAGAIGRLAHSLKSIVGRPVLNETGLAGNFEWRLSFQRSEAAPDAGGTQIDAALQEQLGLKLERKTAPFEFLVIDSIEMPSEN